ncbi:hypothetical protein [Curtobacterium sp. MCSS17_016]|uniref:hypothetical protein n=1 Tax=Curtobacterium sp. MCSS17_016 TaxID=2175644 RepID=UPI000DA6F16F|nr:hypothetical protein [Curtobacterium sp. MCSS17_016]WIE81396.1 hypothetical protein DEJ19_019365 [Curtobacterium sp. MCSS17_016]
MSLDTIRAALTVIAEHQTFIEKARTAFPPDGDDDAEPVGYINLRHFGVQFSKHTGPKARPVDTQRTWFTAWESARIADALRTVQDNQGRAAAAADEATTAARDVEGAQAATADATSARNIAAGARRLRHQRRFAWLRSIDSQLSGLSPQRVLNRAESDALRLAVQLAGDAAATAKTQLEADFNASVTGDAA